MRREIGYYLLLVRTIRVVLMQTGACSGESGSDPPHQTSGFLFTGIYLDRTRRYVVSTCRLLPVSLWPWCTSLSCYKEVRNLTSTEFIFFIYLYIKLMQLIDCFSNEKCGYLSQCFSWIKVNKRKYLWKKHKHKQKRL